MYLGRKHVASKKVRFQEKEGQNRNAVSKLKRRQLSTARAENTQGCPGSEPAAKPVRFLPF